jgi:hypothetical protein
LITFAATTLASNNKIKYMYNKKKLNLHSSSMVSVLVFNVPKCVVDTWRKYLVLACDVRWSSSWFLLHSHSLLENKHLAEKNRNKMNKKTYQRFETRLKPFALIPSPALSFAPCHPTSCCHARRVHRMAGGRGDVGDAAAVLNAKKKKREKPIKHY